MKTLVRLVLLALATVALVAAARALAESTPGGPRPVGPTAIVLPALDPMAAEMQAELERGQRAYAEAFRRLATARGEAEAFAIQEELRQGRVGLQVALLRIQSAYARRAGRERLAAQLDRAVAELVAPENAVRSAVPERGKL